MDLEIKQEMHQVCASKIILHTSDLYTTYPITVCAWADGYALMLSMQANVSYIQLCDGNRARIKQN